DTRYAAAQRRQARNGGDGTPRQGTEDRRLEYVHWRRTRREGLVHGRREGRLSLLGADEEAGRQEPVCPQGPAAGGVQREGVYAAGPGEGRQGLAGPELHRLSRRLPRLRPTGGGHRRQRGRQSEEADEAAAPAEDDAGADGQIQVPGPDGRDQGTDLRSERGAAVRHRPQGEAQGDQGRQTDTAA